MSSNRELLGESGKAKKAENFVICDFNTESSALEEAQRILNKAKSAFNTQASKPTPYALKLFDGNSHKDSKNKLPNESSTFSNWDVSPSKKIKLNIDLRQNKFTHEEFIQACKKYDGDFILPEFLKYNGKQVDGKTVFSVQWPNKNETVELEFGFSTFQFPQFSELGKKEEPAHFSWLFTEKDFCSLHGYVERDRIYYDLEIIEKIEQSSANPEECKILKIWLDANGKFGELFNLQKGNKFSGTQVMNVYNELNKNFLHIKSEYLSDASRSLPGNEQDDNQIVFRVLMTIAYDETWYEKFGFHLFSFSRMRQGYHSFPGKPGEISQNEKKYKKAKERIRNMSLDNLYDYFKEQGLKDKADLLAALAKKYLNIDILGYTGFEEKTLSELTKTVYDAYKNQSNNVGYDELYKMYSLLKLPKEYTWTSRKSNHQFYPLLETLIFSQFFVRHSAWSPEGKSEIEVQTSVTMMQSKP